MCTPEIHSDIPWWVDKEFNFSRLQAALRGEFILGRDQILKLEEKENGK